jgi:hypothetical protein
MMFLWQKEQIQKSDRRDHERPQSALLSSTRDQRRSDNHFYLAEKRIASIETMRFFV